MKSSAKLLAELFYTYLGNQESSSLKLGLVLGQELAPAWFGLVPCHTVEEKPHFCHYGHLPLTISKSFHYNVCEHLLQTRRVFSLRRVKPTVREDVQQGDGLDSSRLLHVSRPAYDG